MPWNWRVEIIEKIFGLALGSVCQSTTTKHIFFRMMEWCFRMKNFNFLLSKKLKRFIFCIIGMALKVSWYPASFTSASTQSFRSYTLKYLVQRKNCYIFKLFPSPKKKYDIVFICVPSFKLKYRPIWKFPVTFAHWPTYIKPRGYSDLSWTRVCCSSLKTHTHL